MRVCRGCGVEKDVRKKELKRSIEELRVQWVMGNWYNEVRVLNFNGKDSPMFMDRTSWF